MKTVPRGIAVASFGLSVALLGWSACAAFWLSATLSAGPHLADPPAAKTPEEAGAYAAGTLLVLGIGLLFYVVSGLFIALQAVLGALLGLAAALTWSRHRGGWGLHVAWAIFALIVEVPICWVLLSHGLGAWGGGVLAGSALVYAVFLLFVGPIVRFSGPWPWTRPPGKPKPKPLTGDFA